MANWKRDKLNPRCTFSLLTQITKISGYVRSPNQSSVQRTDPRISQPIFVNDAGTAIVNPPGPSTQSFSIDPSSSLLFVSLQNSPHAIISFQNSGTHCGSSGPLLFGSSNSNKCSQQPSRSLTSDNAEVIVKSMDGVFEICNQTYQVSVCALRWQAEAPLY